MPSRDEELDALTRGARSLGTELDTDQASGLIDFLDLLYFWNRSSRLTAIVRTEAIRLHLLDSLSVSPLLDTATVADLGTGAGFPGIPLAVTRPEIRFFLVESSRRRCSFLHEALRRLGRTNVSVLESDVETLVRSKMQFETVVSRAFRPPGTFLEIARMLLPVGGRAIVMGGLEKGGGASSSSEGHPTMEFEFERRLELPQGKETRTLAAFRRVG